MDLRLASSPWEIRCHTVQHRSRDSPQPASYTVCVPVMRGLAIMVVRLRVGVTAMVMVVTLIMVMGLGLVLVVYGSDGGDHRGEDGGDGGGDVGSGY